MAQFLDNFINALSSFKREKVSSILEEVRVGKEQLDTISDRLLGSNEFYPLVIATESSNNIISSPSMSLKLRDVYQRLGSYYDESNAISLLLDSHASLLGSDIKAIEDELLALEKMANNYAFLLADGGTYNYAYLEPFSDERGRDVFGFSIPDRAGQIFDNTQSAVVRSTEGALALTDILQVGSPMVPFVFRTNASGFIVSDDGIANLTSRNHANGWRMTMISNNPISSALPGANGRVGAQVILEFDLDNVAPCTQINIAPTAEQNMELLQATVFISKDDGSGKDLLQEVLILDRPITLHFPLQSVAKFRLHLNQPTYIRDSGQAHLGEATYRKLHNTLKDRRIQDHQNIWQSDRFNENQKLQKIIRQQNYEAQYDHTSGEVGVPAFSSATTFGPMNLVDALKGINSHETHSIWHREDSLESGIVGIVQNNFDQWFQLFKLMGHAPGDVDKPIAPQVPPPIVGLPPVCFQYRYVFGLRYVAIGVNTPAFKGVFVSRPIPAPGDIGECRLKAVDDNYSLTVTDRNSSQITSIEYSVSNVTSPQNENDWTPIIPANSSPIITAERFFPDDTGRGFLRFPANPQAGYTLYRNGYIETGVNTIVASATSSIVGLTVLANDVNTPDIFTCDYTPDADYTTISFIDSDPTRFPLVSAYDNNGAGEGFYSTGPRNTVTLSNEPYIDYTQVAGSTYDPFLGLSPYKPILVVLDNDTVPVNLTNYIPSSTQQTSLLTGSVYYYIHSGNTLIFNQPIKQPFRVFYKYLQNTVRVRAVLRINDSNFVSPVVHSFHLKTKTRSSNSGKTL